MRLVSCTALASIFLVMACASLAGLSTEETGAPDSGADATEGGSASDVTAVPPDALSTHDASSPQPDGGSDALAGDAMTIADGQGAMDASVTCTGCPDATTVLYVAPASAGELRGIAVDTSNLYFAVAPAGGGGSILTCKRTGCAAPSALVNNASEVDNPEGVAVDLSGLYWANNSVSINGSFSCLLPTCSSPLSDVPGAEIGIAIESPLNDLYLGTSGGQLKQCSTANNSCSSPNTTLTNPVYGIVVDSSHVYWGSGSYIYTATHASVTSTAASLVNDVGREVYGMSLSSSLPTRLYWLSRAGGNGEARSCALPGCSSVQPFATGLPSPWGIATDANYAYVTVNSPSGNGILKFPHP